MGAHATGFRRVKAPVLFLRAGTEDSSLFNFAFDDEDGRTTYGAQALCPQLSVLCTHGSLTRDCVGSPPVFVRLQCMATSGRTVATT
jgi:hypothetical protein